MVLLERVENLNRLRTLHDHLDECGGRVVFVHGDAGIGKSSLINAFMDALPASVVRARGLCDPMSTPRPFGPLRDMAPDLEALQFGSIPDFDSVTRTLVGDRGCRVLIIEDLHWADQGTLDWLKYIGRRVSEYPLLLIGTYRDDELEAGHLLPRTLGALPTSTTLRMPLKTLSDVALAELCHDSDWSVDRLMSITAGNPLFVTELLAYEATRQGVPESVSDIVLARMATLSDACRRMLECLSCVSRSLSLQEARAFPVCTNESIDEAIDRRFLSLSGAALVFQHELTRMAIQDRLTGAYRIRLHEQWLEWLQQADPPDRVSILHHAQAAARSDVILAQAPEAARQAARYGAHREAARVLQQACSCLGGRQDPEAAALLEHYSYEAGLALTIDEEVIAARQRALSIRESLGDMTAVAENLRWLSRYLWYQGRAEEAQRLILRAVSILESQPKARQTALARAYALRAQFFMLQDQMDLALEWGEKALKLARSEGEKEVQAHALNTLGCARLFRGDWHGESLLRQSLAVSLAERLHEQAARVYTNLSECLIEWRELDAAEALVEQGISFDTAHDLDAWTWYLVGRKAQLFFERDAYRQALQVADGVLARQGQTLLMRIPARIVRARCLLRLGSAEAQAELDRTVADALQIGEPQYLVPMMTARIEACVLGGDRAAAEAAHDWIASLPGDSCSPRKSGEWLFWARLAGFSVPVHDRELPEGFARSLAGEHKAAATAFDAEQSLYLAAWSLHACTTIDSASTVLERFRALSAVAAVRALEQSMSGERERRHYGVARHHPYQLTARELEILGLLTRGLTNDAIAAQLHRSRRTVERHVSSLLAKMHCSKRLDAVLRVQSEPWILEPVERSQATPAEG